MSLWPLIQGVILPPLCDCGSGQAASPFLLLLGGRGLHPVTQGQCGVGKEASGPRPFQDSRHVSAPSSPEAPPRQRQRSAEREPLSVCGHAAFPSVTGRASVSNYRVLPTKPELRVLDRCHLLITQDRIICPLTPT